MKSPPLPPPISLSLSLSTHSQPLHTVCNRSDCKSFSIINLYRFKVWPRAFPRGPEVLWALDPCAEAAGLALLHTTAVGNGGRSQCTSLSSSPLRSYAE